ncbi:TPA: hypothetical protein UMT89_001707 [Stenotrophomonas maltophilia]|nr:hypothetical protein [Stenotrophomonas maltophilia]
MTDPVGQDIYVMEQTLPYCWPGSSASTCQEVDDLVLPLDDRWPPQIHALRLQLQADLVPANRRPAPVPAAALAGAQRMDAEGLRALRERGCASGMAAYCGPGSTPIDERGRGRRITPGAACGHQSKRQRTPA